MSKVTFEVSKNEEAVVSKYFETTGERLNLSKFGRMCFDKYFDENNFDDTFYKKQLNIKKDKLFISYDGKDYKIEFGTSMFPGTSTHFIQILVRDCGSTSLYKPCKISKSKACTEKFLEETLRIKNSIKLLYTVDKYLGANIFEENK